MHINTKSVLALATALAAVAAPLAPAAAAPQSWLPDAHLVCGSETLRSDEWVALPPSGTLWIKKGTLAGHYVILSDTHYFMPGHQAAPPASYDGLELLGERSLGTKTGLEGESFTCHFVSRLTDENDRQFSVVGWIAMTRVGPSAVR